MIYSQIITFYNGLCNRTDKKSYIIHTYDKLFYYKLQPIIRVGALDTNYTFIT